MKCRMIAAAVCMLLCLLSAPALADRANRLLLIGCDRFLTQEETTPASANNVSSIAAALSGGMMSPEALVTRRGDISSVRELVSLIADTFADADEDDVSYFYISTHGVWDVSEPGSEMGFLLSDGRHEEVLTARELKQAFDGIQGTKVLILDACHAGAVIGKGVDSGFENTFRGADYKVLCASGGTEESWFWSAADRETSGSGYFSDALCLGLSMISDYGADADRDGTVTLRELQRYLLRNHGASTPRVYPEEDDFPLFRYEADAVENLNRNALMTGLSFSGSLLDGAFPAADFTFTLLRPAQLAYQLVTMDRNRWSFDRMRQIWDTTEPEAGFGVLSPGTKSRSLSLQRQDEESGGYVLLQIVAMTDHVPTLLSSRVLCVPPLTGDPELSVEVQPVFCPEALEECAVIVRHRLPCALSVTVESVDGQVIRRLAAHQATRPEKLYPDGSFLCWNGRAADGSAAQPGAYRIHASAVVGDETYECWSEAFVLTVPAG